MRVYPTNSPGLVTNYAGENNETRCQRLPGAVDGSEALITLYGLESHSAEHNVNFATPLGHQSGKVICTAAEIGADFYHSASYALF